MATTQPKPLHQQIAELRDKVAALRARPPKNALQNLLHFLAGCLMAAGTCAAIWFWHAHVETFLGQVGCGCLVICLLFTAFQAFEESGRP
jgi:hypothetical protein